MAKADWKDIPGLNVIGWRALDLVKVLLVTGMIWIHSIFWLISENDTVIDVDSIAYPLLPQLSFIGLLPLCIPIAAGAVLRMHFERFLRNNRLSAYPLKSILLVSLFLAASGFSINGLAFGPADFLSWDVLGFIAVCYLCTVALASIHLYAVFFAGIVVLMMSNTIVALFLGQQSYLSGVLVGSESGFYWPFFPWFFVFSFGVLIAHVWIQKNYFKTIVAVIGTSLVSITAINRGFEPTIDPNNLWGLDIFQPGTYFIIGLVGIFCILILGAEFLERRVRLPEVLVHGFSKGILIVYAFHLIVGYRLAPFIKANLPDTIGLLFFPIGMIFLSWIAGIIFVKYLYKKQLRITLKRCGPGEGF